MKSSTAAYKEVWDKRYNNPEYAYGKTPNLFFKEQLDKLPPGNILLPAEGEGRNAVYAATKGWSVTAFDLSGMAKEKAEQLAGEHNMSMQYLVGDLASLDFKQESFDVVGLIYAHFLPEEKLASHKKLSGYLKKGGFIIFEAFSKKNLPLVQANPNVGGAMDERMLFSPEEIESVFPAYAMHILEEKQICLSEGLYHNGTGAVVRFVGQKPTGTTFAPAQRIP